MEVKSELSSSVVATAACGRVITRARGRRTQSGALGVSGAMKEQPAFPMNTGHTFASVPNVASCAVYFPISDNSNCHESVVFLRISPAHESAETLINRGNHVPSDY